MLRWLDEQEDKLLAGIGANTNETGRSAWYNGKNSTTAAKQTAETKNAESGDYILVPKQTAFGPKSNNPAVNCYGYVLMYLGIQPSDGNYDIQPGQLSEKKDGDHAHVETPNGPLNTDITTIANYIIRDVEQAGENIRVIDSYKDANEDETVIALKTTHPSFFGSLDYHCLVQLQAGTWADKQGTANDSRQGVLTNPDEDWVSSWKRYNSETIYFAISEQ